MAILKLAYESYMGPESIGTMHMRLREQNGRDSVVPMHIGFRYNSSKIAGQVLFRVLNMVKRHTRPSCTLAVLMTSLPLNYP